MTHPENLIKFSERLLRIGILTEIIVRGSLVYIEKIDGKIIERFCIGYRSINSDFHFFDLKTIFILIRKNSLRWSRNKQITNILSVTSENVRT